MMNARVWRAWACAVLVALAGCGGGDESAADGRNAAAATLGARAQAAARLQADRLPASASVAAVAATPALVDMSPAAVAERLFAFGEHNFPGYFPTSDGAVTQVRPTFVFRYYPKTGIFLAVVVADDPTYTLNGVYVLGGPFGEQPQYVAQVGSLLDSDGDGVLDATDAVPGDAVCALAVDADQGDCLLRAFANQRARLVGSTAAGLLFFSAEADAPMLHAYDAKTGHFVARQALRGYTPTVFAHSPDHGRLYVGDTSGGLHAYSEALVAQPGVFARTTQHVSGLVAVGKYLMAEDGAGAWGSHYLFDRGGMLTERREWNSHSSVFEWSPGNARVYYFRDGMSPNDLMYETVDQATGRVSANGESPYHGDYTIRGPIRSNPSGSRVLLGSGDLYAAPGLEWAGKVPVSNIVDALWLNDSEVVVVADGTLMRYGATREQVERVPMPGQLLGLVRHGSGALVVVLHEGRIDIRSYAPSNDSDGDGVDNATDRFPLDAAAAVDSDGDGHPDAWLPGRSQADSTTGLTLDAYPRDAACHLASQGDGTRCDPALYAPPAAPDEIVDDGNGTLYLLGRAQGRLYRWSAASGNFLSPLVVGQLNAAGLAIAPTRIAHSLAHKRLYLGYESGRITFVDLAGSSTAEKAFAATAGAVRGLASAGNHVMAQDDTGAWATHYYFDKTGRLTQSQDWNTYSGHYAWSAGSSRLYFFRDGTSPNDLLFEELDTATGKIKSSGETPYHGAYTIQGPIRVNPSGSRVLLGSGDLYAAPALEWAGKIPVTSLVDAQWLSDSEVVVIGEGMLRRFDATRQVVEQLPMPGQLLALVRHGSGALVVALQNGRIEVRRYTPSNDSDGDGVDNANDRFPLDRAAAVDSDGDGHPDAWLPGRSQADSTTGLTLDAYPQDAACHMASQGDGTRCDPALYAPPATPDQIVDDGNGTLYLLGRAQGRLYRWSAASGNFLPPLVVGQPNGAGLAIAPTRVAHSPAHKRLYLGYESGRIAFIDLTGSSTAEKAFAATAGAVRGLASAGNHVMAQDDTGAWATHYYFDKTGLLTQGKDWNTYSGHYAWSDSQSRLYFFRDGTSPNDLLFEELDTATGKIRSSGETPYHGERTIRGPIRISTGGGRILLASGDIYSPSDLRVVSSLDAPMVDMQWLADGRLVLIRAEPAGTRLATYTGGLVLQKHQLVTGQPLALAVSGSSVIVVTLQDGSVRVTKVAQ